MCSASLVSGNVDPNNIDRFVLYFDALERLYAETVDDDLPLRSEMACERVTAILEGRAELPLPVEVSLSDHAHGHLIPVLSHRVAAAMSERDEFLYDDRGDWVGIRREDGSEEMFPLRVIGELREDAQDMKGHNGAAPDGT